MKYYFRFRYKFLLIFYLFCSSLIINAQLITKKPAVNIQQQIDEYINFIQGYKEKNDLLNLANYYNKVAFLYWEAGSTKEAVHFFSKSIQMNENMGNLNGVKNILTNIGMIYSDAEDFQNALTYYNKSLKINKQQNKINDVAYDLLNISQAQQYLGNYQESNTNALKAVEYGQEFNNIKLLRSLYNLLAENHDKLGNSKESLKYYDLYAALEKHIQKEKLKQLESHTKQVEQANIEKTRQLESAHDTLQEVIKDIEKKNLQLALSEKEKQLSEMKVKEQEKLILAERQQKLTILLGAIIVIALVTLFSIIVFGQYKAKKKANLLLEQKNNEVETQKIEVERQRDIAHQQKKKITDSIVYAKRIQNAILPPNELIDSAFEDYFILYKPRDIVSGDFYWCSKKENFIIIAAADCTGHGVPGAFMSMLGIAFLNEIVNKLAINKHIQTFQANEILNQLRERVIESLHQKENSEEPKDGMDISLCIIDTDNNTIQYSGAHNPLYIVRNGELIQYKGDRMPVSIHKHANEPFTNNVIKLEKDDYIYMLSDGYIDQLGGEKGLKFMSKRFRELLLEMYQKPLLEQKLILDTRFEEWRGNTNQLDDLLVIGIRYTGKKRIKSIDSSKSWIEKRILIAEDTDINYFLLTEALQSTGAQVLRASNGREAVEFCQQNNVDLVLMDINMPIMNGIEATMQIRTFSKELPIIAQTAQNDDEAKEAMMKSGCNDYISKPIDIKSFLKTIEKHLFKN